MKKQTSVEWFYEQLPDYLKYSKEGFEMLQQAKAKEEQIIVDACTFGMNKKGGTLEDATAYYTNYFKSEENV